MTGYRNLFLVAMMALVSACQSDIGPINEEPLEPQSSWQVIQQQILEPNCVDCHSAGTSFAKESGLVLTADVAYDQLVGRDPKNRAALNDGLELLGTEGLPSLAKSFLWEKINVLDYEHLYNDHPGYGSLMPLGSKPLTNGELEYIRKWIVEGAPEDGFVADVELLNDSTRFDPIDNEFVELSEPQSGLSFHLGPFTVHPNNEREFFYYWPLQNSEEIYATRFESSMRSGSHHFIFYKFAEDAERPAPFEYRDFRTPQGAPIFETYRSVEDQIFVWGTQWPRTDYSLPEGVALRIEANQGLDLNAHYVNYSNEPYEGEIYANIHTVSKDKVTHIADNLFLNNTDFNLPANKKTTITKTYDFNKRINVLNLWSHAHKRMEEFRVYIKGGSREGELVYYTNDWEHPPLIEFDPPLVLNQGQGLQCEATYFNESNSDIQFGLLSEDEMMILFGMYY
ncbi:hypothetical protein [Portibacter marinus]|uniref:hypothetical protein n=1 Tax=Portibacter marinus TaxID=2898660 RepID=UPI001F415117|nr:hypothetical protein [Portibacter marinus]